MKNIEVKLTGKDEQSVSAWTGGTTTQLAIWPPESDYKRRDFMWRISTARVDLEESVFTALPGYHRLLMILEGATNLTHEVNGKRSEITLNAFDQTSFEGDWDTTSRGSCVDFNLMTDARCSGSIEALKCSDVKFTADLFTPLAEPCELNKLNKNAALVTDSFYCLRSGVLARMNEPYGEAKMFEAKLERGDFLMFSAHSDFLATLEQAALRVTFENIGGEVWGIRTRTQGAYP